MLNQFRTLLLNLPYTVPDEHIPQNFSGKVLPPALSAIYDILFPPDTTREQKIFLVQNYLNCIHAAGLDNVVTSLDSRISYDLNSSDFFKLNYTSLPVSTSLANPMFLRGEYTEGTGGDNTFIVAQDGNTAYVYIYSTTDKMYYQTDGTTSTARTPVIRVALQFPNGNNSLSNLVTVGKTGLQFQIYAANQLTDVSNTSWTFSVEKPYKVNLTNTINQLKASLNARALPTFKPEVDVKTYNNLWQNHYSVIYQFAGFLCMYVLKVNAL